jgi:hypothetical protein
LIASQTSIKPGLWVAALPNGSAGRSRQDATLSR